MKILLTGATGYVGSAVLAVLRSQGHQVTAVVRSEEAAAKAEAAGANAVVHELADTAWLTEALRGVDGAIHTAATADGSDPERDDAVIDAVVAAFSGTDKPYVHTSGVWIWGESAQISESDPFDAPSITAWRLPRDERVVSSGIRGSVIAPAIVYGHGKGIPSFVISGAPRDADGALVLVGDGTQHWTTVHVDDLAELYALVLQTAPGGERYIGASGVNPTVRELGQAVAGSVVASSIEATQERLGAPFAEALLLSEQTDAAKAKALGWTPSRPTLVEELRSA